MDLEIAAQNFLLKYLQMFCMLGFKNGGNVTIVTRDRACNTVRTTWCTMVDFHVGTMRNTIDSANILALC
jgi:hypothetical protein